MSLSISSGFPVPCPLTPSRSIAMDVLVAAVADDQGLAPACGHPLDPQRPFPASRPVQIREAADVVDLERPILGAAVLASLREEALDDLASAAAVNRWRAVAQDHVPLPCQRDAAERGYERPLALASLPGDHQGRLGASSVLHLRPQPTIDRSDPRLMLVGKGPEQRSAHDVTHSPQAVGNKGSPPQAARYFGSEPMGDSRGASGSLGL